MSQSPNVMKKNGRGAAAPGEDAGTFDRSFKYAVVVYAVVEFVAVVLVLYYKLAR